MSGAEFTRSGRLVTDGPDPLNWYYSLIVRGQGWEAEYKTTDMLSLADRLEVWDELENMLREDIKREDEARV